METQFSLEDSPSFRMIRLDEVDSTNSYLRRLDMQDDQRPTLVTAEFQSAGRGADTNRWESERAKNLLFSLRLMPGNLPVRRMFAVSEVAALAVRDALNAFAPGFCIKWPNDIYYEDSKVAGILIENDLQGAKIRCSTIGIGINVNQREFHSDAPNPVSLCQITDQELDCHELLMGVTECFCHWYNCLMRGEEQEIARQYAARLIWREGLHRYCDREGEFEAEFVCVAPDGRLTLRDGEGRERSYYFKEVKHVLKS